MRNVFINHLDVDTFTFDVSKPEKLDDWKIFNGADPFDLTYRMTVSQFYESKYGNLHNLSASVCGDGGR